MRSWTLSISLVGEVKLTTVSPELARTSLFAIKIKISFCLNLDQQRYLPVFPNQIIDL
jgi:hypothetical protein